MPPQQLFGRAVPDLLHRPADHADAAVEILHHHLDRRVLHEAAEAGLAVAQGLLAALLLRERPPQPGRRLHGLRQGAREQQADQQDDHRDPQPLVAEVAAHFLPHGLGRGAAIGRADQDVGGEGQRYPGDGGRHGQQPRLMPADGSPELSRDRGHASALSSPHPSRGIVALSGRRRKGYGAGDGPLTW